MEKKNIFIIIAIVVVLIAAALATFFLLKKEPAVVDDNIYLEDVVVDEETQAILDDELRVGTLGFMILYGRETTGYSPVNLTNKTEEPQSYEIEIKAFGHRPDEDDDSIEYKEKLLYEETFEALDLQPGERTRFELFNDVDKDDYQTLNKGTFVITKITKK